MILTLLQTATYSAQDMMRFPPGSMIITMLVSIGVSLLSTILNRVLIDPKRLQEKQNIIKNHREKRKQIDKLENENPKKYRKELTKWERQDKVIQKMQQKMGLERLKPSLITLIPIMVMFYLLRNFFGNGPIAISPMNAWDIPYLGSMMWGTLGINGISGNVIGYTIPKELGMINFTAWYFLCSFAFNMIIQKLAGTSTGTTGLGGFDQIFEQAKYDQYKT